jgi:hypothetical protein
LSLLGGCAGSSSPLWPEPPSLVAVVDGEALAFTMGSYHWNRTIADAPAPDWLVKEKAAYRVRPDAEATVRFSRNSPDDVRVGLWEEEGLVDIPNDEGGFRLPSDPGDYVLTVVAVWENGDRADYAAAIEVIQEK